MRPYVIVVPADMHETCAELTSALAGEDVTVVLDRRRADRRRSGLTLPLDRRRVERRAPHPPAAIRPSPRPVDPQWASERWRSRG
jgi:hypothetical protein